MQFDAASQRIVQLLEDDFRYPSFFFNNSFRTSFAFINKTSSNLFFLNQKQLNFVRQIHIETQLIQLKKSKVDIFVATIWM